MQEGQNFSELKMAWHTLLSLRRQKTVRQMQRSSGSSPDSQKEQQKSSPDLPAGRNLLSLISAMPVRILQDTKQLLRLCKELFLAAVVVHDAGSEIQGRAHLL